MANARINRSERRDLNNFIFCTGIDRAGLVPIEDDMARNRCFQPAKKLSKKREKKACHPLGPSAKRGFEGTKRPRKPFKKTLKKVKKKLVRHAEI